MTRTLPVGLLLSLVACGDEKAHDHDHDDAPTDPAGEEADADTDADTDADADADSDADTDADSDADSDADTDADPLPSTVTGPDADGAFTVFVNATDAAVWVGLDLDAGAFPADGSGELAFSRYNVAIDGGISGDGGLHAISTDLDFATALAGPLDGWGTDLADADADGDPEYALGDWYSYDSSTHTLSPAGITHLLRAPDGRTWAVEWLDYYAPDGASGYPQLRYRALPADWRATIDAADSAAPVYLRLDGLQPVAAPADPTTSPDWDLSLARTTLRLNGGASGPGAGAAATLADGTDWASIAAVPADADWQLDRAPAGRDSGAALNTWFSYDPTTHTVAPTGRVHLVRAADGTPYKLSVTAWADGVIDLRVSPVTE